VAAVEQRYTLIRQIAVGGMAEVWKATASGSAGFAKTVAIKRILPGLAQDREFVDRFIAEARVAAALVHPNIVQVFDFGELEPGVYFLAMEYVPGVDAYSLARHAYEKGMGPGGGESTGLRGVLPASIAIHLCMETARGLGYAHSRKPQIVHRDVSPQNILISFDGEVKLADFGIAKVSGSATAASVIKGKLSYMSPEQTRGDPVDGSSDLFSLGVTLYRLLTARPLFAGETLGERLAAASSYQGISRDALALVPQEVRPVLERALKPKQKDRYVDAGEMEAALGDCLGTASTVSIRRALASYVREVTPDFFKQELRESSSALSNDPLRTTKSRRLALDAARSRKTLWIGAGVGAVALGAASVYAVPKLLDTRMTPSPAPVISATPIATATPSAMATARVTELARARATPTVIAVKTTATPAPTARSVVRDVAVYDVTFLAGCTPAELALADASIRGAIRRGIPLFNSGDTAGCFQVYRDTALSVRGALPETCSGPRAALWQGIQRADQLATPGEKAYALRDAFDALINVMTKKANGEP